MKRRIWKISEDRFDDVKPELNISPSVIELNGNEEHDLKGSFTISSKNNVDVKGYVFSSSPYVVCDTPIFEGRDIEISFHTNTKDFTSQDSIEGYFDIVYNMGEVRLPFKINFDATLLVTSIGEIKTMEDFGKLCEVNFQEGLALFRTRPFERFINKQDIDTRVLYKGYVKAVPSGINLQHFLEEVGLNAVLEFELDKDSVVFEDILDDQRGSVNIKRSSWGKLDVFASTESSFIDLPLKRISEGDFLGREYDYQFYIRTEKMHRGKNIGFIEFYDGIHRKKVKVEASLLDEELPVLKLNFQKQKIRNEIFRDLLAYRTGNLNIASFTKKLYQNLIISFKIDESQKSVDDAAIYFDENGMIHERKEREWEMTFDKHSSSDEEEYISYRLPVFDRLLLSHARILNNERQKALWLIRDLKVDIKNHNSFEWAYLLYLCILIDPDEHYQEKLTDEIEKIFRMNSEDSRIFIFLLYLRKVYVDDAARKLKDIKQWVNSGYVSPFLLAEALDIYKMNPYLLQGFDKFVIFTLNFARKNDSFSSDIASELSGLLKNEKEYNDTVFSIVTSAYSKYQSFSLLEEILNYLIRNEKFDKQYVKWYKKGIDEGINATGLFEAYLNSLPIDSVCDIPEPVLLYFKYPSNISVERRAYLYMSIIANQNKHPRIYREYLADIESFALAEMQQERIDDNLSVIYQEMMVHNHNFAAFSELVVPFLFINRVAVLREEAKQIILYQDCYNRAIVAPIVNHIAYLPITDKNFRIFLVDMDGTVHTNKEFYMYDSIIHLDTEKGTLPDEYSNSVPAMLYNLTRESEEYTYTKADMPLIESIFKNNDFDEEFLLRKYDAIFELLKDNAKEDILLSYIWDRRNKLSLPNNIVKEVLGFAIREQKYEEAYEYLKTVDASLLDERLLLALCNYMIVYFEFAAVDKLITLCAMLLMDGFVSQATASYLEKYFVGATETMAKLFEVSRECDVRVKGYAEKVLTQMLYVAYMDEFPEEIFLTQISDHGNRMVKEAALTFWSREAILNGRKLPDRFYSELYRSVLLDDNVNDSMRIALVKFMCEQKELSKEETNVLDKFLRYYISRNIRLPFFNTAPKGLKIKYHLNDKSYVSFSYKSNAKLYVRVKINDDDPYIVPLSEVYSGLYIRAFVLFSGDVLTYDIIEDKKDGDVIESGKLSGPDYFEKKEESRFDRINHMKYSLVLNSKEDVAKTIAEYGSLDMITRELFKGM